MELEGFILEFPQYLCNRASPRATGDRDPRGPRGDSVEVSENSARPGAGGSWGQVAAEARRNEILQGFHLCLRKHFKAYKSLYTLYICRDLGFPFGTSPRLFRGSASMMEGVGVPTGEKEEGKQVL